MCHTMKAETDLPPGIEEALQRYIDHALNPGGFLSAILRNNLSLAVFTASRDMRGRIGDIVFWLWENAPHACWGSEESIERWTEQNREELKNPLENNPEA